MGCHQLLVPNLDMVLLQRIMERRGKCPAVPLSKRAQSSLRKGNKTDDWEGDMVFDINLSIKKVASTTEFTSAKLQPICIIISKIHF